MIPVVTIPEAAFDPSAYVLTRRARRSKLLIFLLKLTRFSALALVAAYVVGLLAIKPLMLTAAEQRLEVLEACRVRLRDLYLTVIGRVEHIPIIGMDRQGKVYADAVCQTEDLQRKQKLQNPTDSFNQDQVLSKLKGLSARLRECLAYQMDQLAHYKVVDFTLKDLKQKTDMVIFDQTKLFTVQEANQTKPLNLSREVRNNIRGIKGMFMSGQA